MTLRKIRFRQTGGFAGLVRGCELAPGSLGAKARAQLEHLVAQSAGGGAARASRPAAEQGGQASDLIQYEIDIETASGTEHFVFDDSNVPEQVAPLVEFLQAHAAPMPLDAGGK